MTIKQLRRQPGLGSYLCVSKAWGPEFDAQNLYKMLDVVVHTCNSSARERETAEFLGLIGQTV